MGGTTDAPVANGNIFCSLDGPSSSNIKTLSVVVGPVNMYIKHL